MPKALIVPLLVALTGSAAPQDGERFNCFRGAPHPIAYLSRMIESVETWSTADKELFVLRCVEARKWVLQVSPGANLDSLLDPKEVRKLSRFFPTLKDNGELSCGITTVGNEVGAAYPHIRAKAKLINYEGPRFRTYPSPVMLFEDTAYEQPVKPFSRSEWGKVLKIMKEGVAWEAKHPEADFGFDANEPFLRRLRMTFPKVKLPKRMLGPRVADVYRLVRNLRPAK